MGEVVNLARTGTLEWKIWHSVIYPFETKYSGFSFFWFTQKGHKQKERNKPVNRKQPLTFETEVMFAWRPGPFTAAFSKPSIQCKSLLYACLWRHILKINAVYVCNHPRVQGQLLACVVSLELSNSLKNTNPPDFPFIFLSTNWQNINGNGRPSFPALAYQCRKSFILSLRRNRKKIFIRDYVSSISSSSAQTG